MEQSLIFVGTKYRHDSTWESGRFKIDFPIADHGLFCPRLCWRQMEWLTLR